MVYGDIFVVVLTWGNQELVAMKDFALWEQEHITYLWNIVHVTVKMAVIQPHIIMEAYLFP